LPLLGERQTLRTAVPAQCPTVTRGVGTLNSSQSIVKRFIYGLRLRAATKPTR
jgi:hypothetical protein